MQGSRELKPMPKNTNCSCVDLYFPDDTDVCVNKLERSTGGYSVYTV